MLITRCTVQLFTCRTEGPDLIFGEGREPGCGIPQLLLLIQLRQEESTFALPSLPCFSGQCQRTNDPVQLATQIPHGSSEARVSVRVPGHECACAVGVLRAKAVNQNCWKQSTVWGINQPSVLTSLG